MIKTFLSKDWPMRIEANVFFVDKAQKVILSMFE